MENALKRGLVSLLIFLILLELVACTSSAIPATPTIPEITATPTIPKISPTSTARTALKATATPVANLRFQVPQEVANFTVNSDGTATIEYFYDFQNDPDSLIDYVDVFIPFQDYSMSDVSADIDGTSLTDFSVSPYVTPGVAIGLGPHSIQSGGSGQVHVIVKNVRDVFYDAGIYKNNLPYAVFIFSPNYFDPYYGHGTTEMTVNLYLPPGVQSSEPTYMEPKSWPGDSTPTSGVASNGLFYYSWRASNSNAFTMYRFGAAFPARLIPAEAIQKMPDDSPESSL